MHQGFQFQEEAPESVSTSSESSDRSMQQEIEAFLRQIEAEEGAIKEREQQRIRVKMDSGRRRLQTLAHMIHPALGTFETRDDADVPRAQGILRLSPDNRNIMLMTRRQWDADQDAWRKAHVDELVELDALQRQYTFKKNDRAVPQAPHIHLLGGGASGAFQGEVV